MQVKESRCNISEKDVKINDLESIIKEHYVEPEIVNNSHEILALNEMIEQLKNNLRDQLD